MILNIMTLLIANFSTNDTKHDNTQHNDAQHNNTRDKWLSA